MKYRLISHIASVFFLVIGLLMLVPAFIDINQHESISAEIYSRCALITIIVSVLTALINRPHQESLMHLNPKEVLFLLNIIWLGCGVIAATPIYFVEKISYTDAIFEAISGITTTGGTIFFDLEKVNHGTLIWRSLLQWVGGIGVIALGIAILPILKVGGMRLFQTQSSDITEKALPRAKAIAKKILGVYAILSILCIVLLKLEGMNWFDAFNYGMSTISTGGFSPHNVSLEYYDNHAMYWTVIFFMLVGSLPFILLWRFSQGYFSALLKDDQVRVFFLIVLTCVIIFGGWMIIHSSDTHFRAFTFAVFNTVSVISTTGLALNYSEWGNFAIFMAFFLSFIGGCSGSTASGIKIFRLQIIFRLLSIELQKQLHPKAIILQKYNGHHISDNILRSLISFVFFYIITFVFFVLVTLMTYDNVDIIIIAVMGTLSNSGLGIGFDEIGNFYHTLPDTTKWLLTSAMLVGRLEIMTILILFTPYWYR